MRLVQDSFLGAGSTTGITTISPNPTGIVIGGQVGCDYQFASSSFVIGIEGAGSGSTMRSSRSIVFALGNPGLALVQANTDFLPGLTARFGYAFDNVLLYANGGVALAGDKFEVSGSFAGTPFDFRGLDNRLGWTVGGGVDWAFSPHWSAFIEYDYYQFGHGNILMSDGINGFSAATIKLTHFGAVLIVSSCQIPVSTKPPARNRGRGRLDLLVEAFRSSRKLLSLQ